MMPSMADALWDLTDALRFEIVTKTVVDHQLAEASKVKPPLFFIGCIQPLPSRSLLVKPEGQRSWHWLTMWTTIELQLDWAVKDMHGTEYRIMNKTNWKRNGYFEYDIIEGPVP